MTKKYVSLSIDSERLLGKLLASAIRKEPLNLKIDFNDKEGNENRPDYKSFDGISIWLKEEKELTL